MEEKRIEFYFDFLSPYSYLAWTWVRDVVLPFDFYPVSVGSLIAFYETKGPAQIAPKRNYLFKDLLRFTKQNNIPFEIPQSLPFNSLYALRFSLKSSAGEEQKKIIDTIFRAGWEKGLDIGSDDSLKRILTENNLYSDELVEKMESKEARIDLKKNVEIAIGKNIFGVPSFVVDDEIFWGNDSIFYLKKYLQGEDPLDKKKYQKFIKNFTSR